MLCARCVNMQHASARHEVPNCLLPHWLVWWTQSVSRGKAGRGSYVLQGIINWSRLFYGQSHRPDLEATVASGLFEDCANGVASVAAAGVDGLGDVNHPALQHALTVLRTCRQQPGAEARIRSLAPALEWCLEHDLDWMEQLGYRTGSCAAQICESLWPLIVVGPYSCSKPVHCRRLWRVRAR